MAFHFCDSVSVFTLRVHQDVQHSTDQMMDKMDAVVSCFEQFSKSTHTRSVLIKTSNRFSQMLTVLISTVVKVLIFESTNQNVLIFDVK